MKKKIKEGRRTEKLIESQIRYLDKFFTSNLRNIIENLDENLTN